MGILNYIYAECDKISLCLHDSTRFFLPSQRESCQLGNEKAPVFPFPCPPASPRNPVSVRITGDGRQGLWCAKKSVAGTMWGECWATGVLDNVPCFQPVCWCWSVTVSWVEAPGRGTESHSGFRVFWVALWSEDPSLNHMGESEWSICVNRRLTCSSGFKQGTASLPVPGMT